MKKKDEEAFLKSISGTSPIKKNNTYTKETSKFVIKKPSIPIINKKENPHNLFSTKPDKKSEFKIEKNSNNKKLKKGRIPIEKKIDFHGFSLSEAEEIFTNTILSCYKKKQRCILFITGKGILKKNFSENSSKLYYGKIRNNFMSWANKPDLQRFILNVEQANIEHGADGAFFVYLRKQKIMF